MSISIGENERSGIMATKSFTDTYVINRDDVNRFHNIMNNKKSARVTKVMGHKDVKSKHAMMSMLGLKKDAL